MKISLSSELNNLNRARAFVREMAQVITNKEMPDESIGQLQMAVTEAITNIIKHSYNNEPHHHIDIIAEAFADGVQIIIYHDGVGFDPHTVQEPVLEVSRDGGLGVFIISKCVEFFGYSTDKQNRNSVRLIKIPKIRS